MHVWLCCVLAGGHASTHKPKHLQQMNPQVDSLLSGSPEDVLNLHPPGGSDWSGTKTNTFDLVTSGWGQYYLSARLKIVLTQVYMRQCLSLPQITQDCLRLPQTAFDH